MADPKHPRHFSDDFKRQVVELERENRRLRMEVDVLKQAALIFARE